MIRDNLPSSVLIDADFVYANDRLAALRIGTDHGVEDAKGSIAQ
ncbi:MAG: hypothetical protein R3C20_15235 [Planctomycetaceae bacterium]